MRRVPAPPTTHERHGDVMGQARPPCGGAGDPALLCAQQLLAASALPRAEARLLLERASGRRREWLLAHADEPLGIEVSERFLSFSRRREAGEPIAYLVGTREFRSLQLVVDPGVLIPRPETELLVEEALKRAPRTARVIDLGTGSGAIAISIAAVRPDLHITATDASDRALAVARTNARLHGEAAARVQFLAGHWWQALPPDRQFDLIVSNPPYIADGDPHLLAGDLRFEPRQALASGPEGLDALREIAAGARARLAPGGWISSSTAGCRVTPSGSFLHEAAWRRWRACATWPGTSG